MSNTITGITMRSVLSNLISAIFSIMFSLML